VEFVLLSFDNSQSTRRFLFEGVAADRSRTKVVVSVDLSIVRRYDLKVQNLPLLCRQLLERCDPAAIAAGSITLTEADMAAVRDAALTAVEERKPRPPRPTPGRVGLAWRGRVLPTAAPK